MKHLLASVLVVLFMYLLFAFVQANLNPFQWTEYTRHGLAFLWVVGLLFTNVSVHIQQKLK